MEARETAILAGLGSPIPTRAAARAGRVTARPHHRRDRDQHQHDRRAVLPVQLLAEPPRAGERAEDRNHHHRHARRDRRQIARQDEPDRLREAEDEHGVVDDRRPRRRARRGPAVALEEAGQRRHGDGGRDRHPEDDGQRRRNDLRAPHLLRAERPDGRRDQHADGRERMRRRASRARARAAARRRAPRRRCRRRGARRAARGRAPRPRAPRRSASCSRGSPRGPTTVPGSRRSRARARRACW